MATWRRISTARWRTFRCDAGDVSISFLPLSHVTARHVDFAMLYRGVTLAHLAVCEPVAAGTAGSEAHIFCRGAAGVRKNSLSNGTEGTGFSELDFYRWAMSVGKETRQKSWPDECRRLGRGSWRTGWSIRKCARAWAGASRFSFPAARRWDANWRSGMPTSGSAFTRATG